MNKQSVIKELKNVPIENLEEKCREFYNAGVTIPPSIIKRLEEYLRVLEMAEFDENFGFVPLAGVDEAGRGPLAGRVYTAAVIFPEGTFIEGLNDSKKLSEKKREMLFDIIIEKAADYSVTFADTCLIDEINIRNATYHAMNEAVNSLKIKPAMVLIDGDAITDMDIAHSCVIGGDAKSLAISAASVLAKVSRDRYMLELDEKYPVYGFAKHKGYGTKQHIDALKTYGASPVHRKTFIKKFV